MHRLSDYTRKLFRFVHWQSLSCGKVPLLALLAVVICLCLGSGTAPSPTAELAAADESLIEAVLSKRAPELGATLRRQLAWAIGEESWRAGYDPLMVLAIIQVESSFEDDAVSPKGARGLMQIRPTTLNFLAKREGIRLTPEEMEADPALRVRLGIRYLRILQDKFHDLDRALMAYNAGPLRLRQALRSREVDVFRRYPRLVHRHFRRFREGVGVEGDWALAQRERGL
jgi:soluble lytic murein transglycosylase-like protein